MADTKQLPRAEEPRRATEFELEDQYKEVHKIQFPQEKNCVLLFADNEGSKQIDGWVLELAKTFSDRIEIQGVALLDEVPSALRSTLRFYFRQRVQHPVLLDWDGKITRQYACKPRQVSLFVLDRDGLVTATEYGAAEGEALKRVTETLRKLLDNPTQKEE